MYQKNLLVLTGASSVPLDSSMKNESEIIIIIVVRVNVLTKQVGITIKVNHELNIPAPNY